MTERNHLNWLEIGLWNIMKNTNSQQLTHLSLIFPGERGLEVLSPSWLWKLHAHQGPGSAIALLRVAFILNVHRLILEV